MLQIRKLSTKTWKHVDSIDGAFILTKFYAKEEFNEFLIVESYGAKRRKYLINEIEVYDIGGTAETFTNFEDLFLRLEELRYTGFYKDGDGDVDLVWGSITGTLSDQTDLQNALNAKLDKVSTAGVERAYIINADGSQSTKATSDFKEVIEGYFNGTNFYTNALFTNLITPESGKIYLNIAVTPSTQYRWSGSVYVQIGGADFLKKDIATYPIASFPLADTDKLILFQGGVPKKIDKSDIHKETTITVELMNNLTSDFYAPNDLIIHSTDIIRGSGTITLKVENVAYTIGQLITRGNKITVETTTPSVYNLNTTPTNTSWQRPADWLPMPTNITETDQIFVGLHAVIENGDNYCSFSFTTSAGQYRVDWGDGNVTLHNSGTIAQYQYNYASISNSTLSSRGYKQVIVKVTPVSGNLLTCNFQQRFVTSPIQNQAYSSGFLECILSMPNANTGQSITLGGETIRHNYCEKVDIKTIGNATNLSNMFNNFYLLKSVPLFNTINATNLLNMFNNCYSLQLVPFFNTINVTNMSGMFYVCLSLQYVPLFNTINVTNMSYMLYNCASLQFVPLFNTINVTNMSYMLYNCRSLNFIPAFVTTAMTTDFTTFATGCSSLNRILMSFNRTVALQNCQLSKDELVEIFTNLTNRTATTSATIDITGNWGSSALTSSNRLIATNKNWVITG